MDLTQLSTWLPLLLFCFGVYVLVVLLRRVVEGVVPKLKVNVFWNEVALPSIAPLLGALCAFPFPFPFTVPNWSYRIALGLTGGFISAYSYRVVKALIKAVTGVSLDEPPAPTAPKS